LSIVCIGAKRNLLEEKIRIAATNPYTALCAEVLLISIKNGILQMLYHVTVIKALE
jgi:hypothetical protein